MTIASISIPRPKLPELPSTAFPLHQPFIPAAGLQHQKNTINFRKQEHNQQQSKKDPLRGRLTFKKQFTTLPPLLSLENKRRLSLENKPPLTDNQAIGTVTSSQANMMRVVVNSDSEIENSGVELLCVVKAVLKKIKMRVFVGDRVLVGAIDWVGRRGWIENVFERKTEILDPPVANVDHLLLLFSLEQPKIEPFMLSMFLLEAESTGIPLTLALNKAELVDEVTMVEWKSRLGDWGYDPIICSVDTKQGLDALQLILRDKTSVVAGPSGVGKSSLINALRVSTSVIGPNGDDNWFEHIVGSKWLDEQRVGEVSTRSGRGKHTTRHVSLLPLHEGGYLADTPGFSQPSLTKVTKKSFAQYFPEIRKKLEENGPCAFSDCLHHGEQGCVVGGDWERYPFYLQLLDEIKIREESQLRNVGTKRESDVRVKIGESGVKQSEPRLEAKKHRRQSRKKVNQSLLDDLDDDDDDDDVEMSDSENSDV
ncbi:hypothetical protein ABFX02_08G005300 [Erythranthe guttata]